MEKLEKIILDTVVDNLVEQLERMDLFEEGFEFAEKYIETLIFKLANKVLQRLVNIKTKEIGFENHLTLSHHGCIRKYKSNSQMSHLNIQTLFGNISMEYKNYYNKTSKSSIKINCVNFKEHDTVSPNVKKKVVLLTPFDFFEDANIKLYNPTNINLSLSALKRITNSVSEKNNDWLKDKIILKNKQFYNESKKAQADRIVISNDGGRFKNINFSEKGRNAKRNPEWKEAKAGVVS